MRSAQFLLAALCLGVALKPAAAQKQHRVSVDLTVGATDVLSDAPYIEVSPNVFDALVGVRWKDGPGHSLVAGASGTRFERYDQVAICGLLPNGECAPSLPTVSSQAVLLGWEALHTSGASFRLLLGPSRYRSEEGGPQSGGHQARIDLSSPHLGWLALALSFRWSHVSNIQNGEIDYRSFGLGLRLR